MALDVSGKCNLACRYCAEAATQPARQNMPEETLEAAWRFLFPDGQVKQGASFRLGSGEPLLGLPLLHKISDLVEQAASRPDGRRPDVYLTTNGTLVSPDVRDWLVASGWHVKISLDGPQRIHDAWRVTFGGQGTYKQIAEAVIDLAQRIPDRFSVTAVLCRDADPAEVFEGIAALGVRRIELVPVIHENASVLPDDNDVNRYRQFVEGYARRYANLNGDQELATLVRFENCARRVMGYDVRRLPCGAGRSFLAAGPEGNLYPCFRFVGLEDYRLGHLTTGLDQEAAALFNNGPGRSYEQRVPCAECWAAPLCGGPCFACSEMFGPGDGRPFELHCAYILADAETAVWLVRQLRASAPERLLNFLPSFARSLISAN